MTTKIAQEEIYCIAFNKVMMKDGVAVTVYSMDTPTIVDGEKVSVASIAFTDKTKTRMLITFSNGKSHEIGFTNDIDIYRRPIKEKKANA